MLTAAGVRMLLERLMPLRLYKQTGDMWGGDPLEVQLPDGSFTLDVPLDVAVEPTGTPGTFVIAGHLGGVGGRKVVLSRTMVMGPGDSFTMPESAIVKAVVGSVEVFEEPDYPLSWIQPPPPTESADPSTPTH
jgi:hypothetical protein